MAYKSGNPALNKDTFKKITAAAGSEPMTLEGVANKSLLMLLICFAGGIYSWSLAASGNPMTMTYVFGALILALILGFVTIFKKDWSPVTAPIYALAEGVVLGAISQIYEAQFANIVMQALLLTAGIFTSMLLLYRLKIIRATENFKLGLAAATGGIFLYYLANLVINFFGHQLPLINSSSIYGIGFTVFVIVIAAFNLVVDFDFIEHGVEQRAPKYMEWYGSFGLFVTTVWLYIELLRLLAKLNDR